MKQTEPLTVAGATPRIKELMLLWLPKSESQWEAQQHGVLRSTGPPGWLVHGATGPASCSGGQPVKTKSPHFLTHSQPLILIQL